MRVQGVATLKVQSCAWKCRPCFLPRGRKGLSGSPCFSLSRSLLVMVPLEPTLRKQGEGPRGPSGEHTQQVCCLQKLLCQSTSKKLFGSPVRPECCTIGEDRELPCNCACVCVFKILCMFFPAW